MRCMGPCPLCAASTRTERRNKAAQDTLSPPSSGGLIASWCSYPRSMISGISLRPEMAYGHIAQIAETVTLPIMVFVYPVTSGLHI